MPDIRSALAGDAAAVAAAGTPLSISEVMGRELLQLAAYPASDAAVAARLSILLGCPIPGDMRTASTAGDLSLFRIAPERLWLTASAAAGLRSRLQDAFDPHEAVITELGHSRTIVRIAGPLATALLQRCVPVDVEPQAFAVGSFAQTAMHGVSVLLHRAGDADHDIYVPRSYAASLWAWLVRAAELCQTP